MMPEWMVYARALFALLFVVGLIFFCAFAAKKTGIDKRFAGGGKGGARKLEVIETLYLDPKHRAVILRSGENEHLLLLGNSGDLLIESKKRDASV